MGKDVTRQNITRVHTNIHRTLHFLTDHLCHHRLEIIVRLLLCIHLETTLRRRTVQKHTQVNGNACHHVRNTSTRLRKYQQQCHQRYLQRIGTDRKDNAVVVAQYKVVFTFQICTIFSTQYRNVDLPAFRAVQIRLILRPALLRYAAFLFPIYYKITTQIAQHQFRNAMFRTHHDRNVT